MTALGHPRARWRDAAWPVWLTVLPAAVTSALILWEHYADVTWGMALVAQDERIQFMGACAGAAGALLGLVIATIAILLALPDGPSMSLLRTYSGWRVLEYVLLAVSLDLLILLTASLVAILSPDRAVASIVTVYAPSCVLALAIAGLLFALVLLNVEHDRSGTHDSTPSS